MYYTAAAAADDDDDDTATVNETNQHKLHVELLTILQPLRTTFLWFAKNRTDSIAWRQQHRLQLHGQINDKCLLRRQRHSVVRTWPFSRRRLMLHTADTDNARLSCLVQVGGVNRIGDKSRLFII